MQNLKNMTIRELASQCETVDDIHAMIRDLFKETLQQVFEAEIEDHLGYTNMILKVIIREIVEMGIVKRQLNQSLVKLN